MISLCRIDTIQQFIEKNLSWGREGTQPSFKEYFDLEVGCFRFPVIKSQCTFTSRIFLLQDKYARQMPSRFTLESSPEEKTQRVLQGNYAVVGKIVGNVYYPEGTLSNEALQVSLNR